MIKLLIVLSLMLVIPLSANAQIVGDGTDNVTIHDYPFDITILEGGSFTLYNYNGTGSISIVSPGWFEEHEALENNTVTVRLIDEMVTGTYYVNDVMNNTIISTVTVVEPYVTSPTIDITVSNDVGNSYVRMTGTTVYQNDTIVFYISDSNQNVIDRYTHVTNYDGSYKAIWTITDYLPDGTYYVTLDDQVRQFEWKSIDSVRTPITPIIDTVVEPVEVVTQIVDKEVLNIRLQILQVIESIFRIVLG
jgi:hypothetical protein